MKKKSIITVVVVIVVLIVGVVIYIAVKPEDMMKDLSAKSNENSTLQTASTSTSQDNVEATQTDISQPTTASTTTLQLTKTEVVKIEYNTPEYDMKITLSQSGNNTFIKLEYYFNGESKVDIIDNSKMPELTDIFKNRDADSSNTEAFRIKNSYLNVALSKLFIVINNESKNDITQTTLYSINLDNAELKKVFSNNGKFSSMFFNKNYRYLAFSYNDPSESSVLQETSLFEVVDCSKDELLIKNSKTIDGKRIGSNIDQKTVYDYNCLGWYSESKVKLLQKPVLKDKTSEKELIYDISKNLFYNGDGSVIKTETEAKTTAGEVKIPAESESIKILKAFYSALASKKDYPEAMKLLDDKFTLKLLILKSFGVDMLVKSDIDVESASGYSDLLKASRLGEIVSETTKDGITDIYYYQTMDTGSGTPVMMAMSAKIIKTGKALKIIEILDADITKPPFAKQN